MKQSWFRQKLKMIFEPIFSKLKTRLETTEKNQQPSRVNQATAITGQPAAAETMNSSSMEFRGEEDSLNGRSGRLLQAVERLERTLNKYRLEQFYEYEAYQQAPKKMLLINLLLGIARGVGFVIGVSFVGAIVLSILAWILSGILEIPVIGHFVAEIIKSAQEYLKNAQP